MPHPPFCCLKCVHSGKQNRAILAADEPTSQHDLQANSGKLGESRWSANPRDTQAATATCVRPMLRVFAVLGLLGVASPQQLHKKSPVLVEEDELEEEEEEEEEGNKCGGGGGQVGAASLFVGG